MRDEEFIDAPLAEIWRFSDDPDHYVYLEQRIDRHQHTPIEFCSDAIEKPLVIACSECGEVLDVSADLLESQHGGGLADKE